MEGSCHQVVQTTLEQYNTVNVVCGGQEKRLKLDENPSQLFNEEGKKPNDRVTENDSITASRRSRCTGWSQSFLAWMDRT